MITEQLSALMKNLVSVIVIIRVGVPLQYYSILPGTYVLENVDVFVQKDIKQCFDIARLNFAHHASHWCKNKERFRHNEIVCSQCA